MWRRSHLGLLLGLLLGSFLGLASAHAGAASELGYTRSQVYSGALRYLRIDLGYDVTEKDPEAAYLLFEYQPQGQTSAKFGSFEIVPTKQGVRLVVRLPQMPSYHEQVLRDGLVRKLREDYGTDAARPRPSKEQKPKGKDDAPPKDDASKSGDGKLPAKTPPSGDVSG